MNKLLTSFIPRLVSLEWHMDYCAKNIDRNQSRERGFFD